MLPLLFGLLQIPLAYGIGSQLRNRDYGLLFASLLAVSPILIEFSQELRMYSLVACLALLQVWLLLYLQRVSSWSGWLSFVLVAVAGVYTHIFYWLFLMGLSLSLLRARPAIAFWKSFAAMAIVVLLYLPNVINLFEFTERRGADYGVHLPSALPKLLAAFTVGFNYFLLPDLGATRAVGWEIVQRNLLITLPICIIGILLIWGFLLAHKKSNRSSSLWFGHELFTIPVIIAASASFVTGKYFLQPKYLIFAAPFLFLVIIESARAFRALRARWTVAGLGALVFLIAFAHYSHPERFGRKENWREAARFLTEQADGESAVLALSPPFLLNYYAPALKPEITFVSPPANPALPSIPETEQLRIIIDNNSMIYYVYWDISQNRYDPRNHLISALDNLIGEHSVYSLNPRLKIYIWKPPPPAESN
ncbi:hypothetical protein EH220_05505 [bacterium]|nr:MAG: hypothetical protein EH220_05505 [bacterium]